MLLSLIPMIGKVIDRVIPDKNAAAKAKAELDVLEQSGELKLLTSQIEVNKEEAKHRSVFVAGWRPSIGWICGFAFGYHYCLYPIIATVSSLFGVDTSTLPVFDISSMTPVLFGMLGLGGLRTFEKFKGVTK